MDIRRNNHRDYSGTYFAIHSRRYDEKYLYKLQIASHHRLTVYDSLHDNGSGQYTKFQCGFQHPIIWNHVAPANDLHYHPGANRAKHTSGKQYDGESY